MWLPTGFELFALRTSHFAELVRKIYEDLKIRCLDPQVAETWKLAMLERFFPHGSLLAIVQQDDEGWLAMRRCLLQILRFVRTSLYELDKRRGNMAC